MSLYLYCMEGKFELSTKIKIIMSDDQCTNLKAEEALIINYFDFLRTVFDVDFYRSTYFKCTVVFDNSEVSDENINY